MNPRTLNTLLATTFGLAVVLVVSQMAMAIEEPDYQVLSDHGTWELRGYAEVILAETQVEADFDAAGDMAFNRLFRYISGDNRKRAEIAMTAPVVQEPSSEKIAMTAPVVQQRDGRLWSVAFVLPATFSWETAPQPTDPRVSLRRVPERTVAALRFSGTWSEGRFTSHETELRSSLAEHGWKAVGPAVYARYNPPFTPWFMRRNEVLIPVTKAE
jgi:hypothetical protein